ncbi:glycosyltransferase involved in cell wall biosynthesis [Devosia subaequoris]|uniref:Glycosyltransferase involved in cell wall biosynthesis n=1 Tax=Devosia subaequoris TaxID=395930 RepID=A0A7W6IKX8_9HYPH|nr:glycosyltransferase family 1 protein [Devosia subaequoris]MBB4051541.1 glycosyltransferase involved in cell wall biosynthesis [Devosia subaequoris]MCP1209134.1 glycosyltransferase family 1 protein [Devosia subaequoris]
MYIDPKLSRRRILIVTDAWRPQINGVVRTLESVAKQLRAWGHEVSFLTPEPFWTVPVPTYPEIRLSLASRRAVFMTMARSRAHHIHIATEGPLGLLARRYCLDRGKAFTTSFHTRFPEYAAARLPLPEEWSYGYLRWFHDPAVATMVPTPSLRTELRGRGFSHLTLWGRGVDGARFHPGEKSLFTDLPGPHLLYVGRVSAEKNVTAFLDLDVPGSKIVVGDGPDRAHLERHYPQVHFIGYLHGEALAAAYRSADVFVFPSRTDTFGNVVTEALASGTPVAAYPVTGPRDVVTDPRAGTLSEDLGAAVRRSLTLRRADARALGEQFTWAASARQFLSALTPAHAASRLAKAI